ncbi:MAG: DNA-binding protein WhiA [Clostridia bacterium]|nr:DNA-binding protein WhiA [Clostridia bacterium]
MNFTRQIKKEVVRGGYSSACCRIACLSAFLRTSGSILTRGSTVGFSFFTESSSTAKFFSEMIGSMFSVEGVTLPNKPGAKEKYVCEFVSDSSLGVLVELGILIASPDGIGVQMGIDKFLIEAECCKRAYVAGAFLGGGSCTVPTEDGARNTGYHLEFVFSYYETAHAFSELLAEFDILAKLIERKNTFVVYVKNNDEIQEVLTLIGADECGLTLAETVVRKDFNNKVNRKLNCDLGNISKQIAAAERQIEAINAIAETVGLSSLKRELKDVCELRLADSLLTLEEMADKLGVTKSCVNHRMRKIMQIASDIKN